MTALVTITLHHADGYVERVAHTVDLPVDVAAEKARKIRGAPGARGRSFDVTLASTDRAQGITRIHHEWTSPDPARLDLMENPQ